MKTLYLRQYCAKNEISDSFMFHFGEEQEPRRRFAVLNSSFTTEGFRLSHDLILLLLYTAASHQCKRETSKIFEWNLYKYKNRQKVEGSLFRMSSQRYQSQDQHRAATALNHSGNLTQPITSMQSQSQSTTKKRTRPVSACETW